MSQAFSPLGREFEPFLYAVIYEDANGMPLTVVSAIARSGVDPWKEAARIAQMPKSLALGALAVLLPEHRGIDTAAIAARLFVLLPPPREKGIAAVFPAGAVGAQKKAARWSLLVTAILILLLALTLASIFWKTQNSDAAPFERPTPSVVDKADL